MKKISTILLSMLPFLGIAQSFSDDFESYAVGANLAATSPVWATWSGPNGGTDDVKVTNTDAHSGTNSLYFMSTSSSGGPTDLVLPFGGQLKTGRFIYTMWMKVENGKAAYFNFQGNTTVGQVWAMDCYLRTDGSLAMTGGGNTMFSVTYPQGNWFELKVDVDLNTSSWELLLDGISQGKSQNTNLQIASIDIYPADSLNSFWLDDVSYNYTPFTTPSLNAALSYISGVDAGLSGQSKTPVIKIRNLGTTSITSFDVTYDYNGSQVTESFSGFSVAANATRDVTFTQTVALANSIIPFTATVSNVNGLGADNYAPDDSKSIMVNPIVPTPNKVVLIEEITGTWCGWCPRGAVLINQLDQKYPGYAQAIAVHGDNGDPMELTTYKNSMLGFVSGYPSVLVDRGNDVDPLAMEGEFMQKIIMPVSATIVPGASWNDATRELKVSLTANFSASVSGDWRIACVLTEDSVTGPSPDYDQVNYYAGGSNGVMGGYEALPSPVPASQMVYNHVARAISPDFDGRVNSFPATVNAGDSYINNFSFTLPAGWNKDKIHIVGFIINDNQKVDNAAAATIDEAVTNGLANGIGDGSKMLGAPDNALSAYPNPANHSTTLSLHLKEKSDVQLVVRNTMGQAVMQGSYKALNGSYLLPLNLENLSSGIYLVEMITNKTHQIVKVVKE